MISNQVAQQSIPTGPILSKQNRYTCVGCRIKFDTSELQREHFKTEWHLYNLKRKVCNLGPIDSDSFQVIQARAPVKEILQTSSNKSESEHHPTSSSSYSKPDDLKNRNKSVDDDDEDDDWDDIDEEELVDEDYDEEEAEKMLARVVKSDTCLFCDKKSSTTKHNLKHMDVMHGFFVPEEQYMIDLEGFMEYLGFKVGAGATCLWCNKQFTSVHGVRRHMINKDHCKIFFNQEKAVDEFKEFYDYSTQIQFPMKPLNELVVMKKRNPRRVDFNANLAYKSQAPGSICGSTGKALVKRAERSMRLAQNLYQPRTFRKFNAFRAKNMLKIAYGNNMTMRSRLRPQNPI